MQTHMDRKREREREREREGEKERDVYEKSNNTKQQRYYKRKCCSEVCFSVHEDY